MAESTDDNPYQKMLGITAEQQPPNHYELLGLTLFEDDLQKVRGAAADQNYKLLAWQSGKSYAQAEQLMIEIGEARDVLLDPKLKQLYDYCLRNELNLPEASPKPQPLPKAKPEPQDEIVPLKPLADEPSKPTESAKPSEPEEVSADQNTYGLARSDTESPSPKPPTAPVPQPVPPSQPATPESLPLSTSDQTLDYTRLGLPPGLTDPTHYELLSLKPFESSTAKISSQILRELTRIAPLVRNASDEDRPMLQALQMKVIAAATTLADVKAKERYDNRLRRLSPRSKMRTTPNAPLLPARSVSRPPNYPPQNRVTTKASKPVSSIKPLWSRNEMRDSANRLALRYKINTNQRHGKVEDNSGDLLAKAVIKQFQQEMPQVASVYQPDGAMEEGGISSLTIGAIWGSLAAAVMLAIGAWITIWAPLMLVEGRTSMHSSVPACCRIVAFLFALVGGTAVSVAAGVTCAEFIHHFGRMASCRNRSLAAKFAVGSSACAFAYIYFLPAGFDWARGLLRLHWFFQLVFFYFLVSAAYTHIRQLINEAMFCEKCQEYMEPRPLRNLRYGALKLLTRAIRSGDQQAAFGVFCSPSGEAGESKLLVCPQCQSGVLEVTLKDSVSFRFNGLDQSQKLNWLVVSQRTSPAETATILEANAGPVKAKPKKVKTKSNHDLLGSSFAEAERVTPAGRFSHLLPPGISCIHCAAGVAWIKPLSKANRYVCRKCGRSFDY
ncbi:hypothetical protein [Thalassoroseus pseudoceratinae]|uniref:hypothetical protein n=1 Tax=Thalassoroseus pseudoceratinae TaxID=2713176 RepID=UPI001424774D|nr:hypothetical protein [Thalassoroseus pseudoceratinae]